MSQLDCNTPLGKHYIREQHACVARLRPVWDVAIATTIDDKAADIDGIIVKSGVVIGVLEIKAREASMDQLRKWGSYLITYEKLLKLGRIAKALAVHGYLVVSLLHDQQIVYWHICGPDGKVISPLTHGVTQTQATSNGGTAYRDNAYLSLESMKVLASSVPQQRAIDPQVAS